MGFDTIILANGNSVIGMGHIMRCIAIAEVLLEKDMSIQFMTKYEQGQNFLKAKGFKTLGYTQDEDLKTELKDRLYDFIIVDSYEVNSDFFELLKKHTKKLVYIDDLNLFDSQVDLIINTAIDAQNIDYKFKSNTKYLLGSKYCILRKEFRDVIKNSVNRKVSNILITTGGADSHNITFEILKFLTEKLAGQNITYHVIIGQAFEDIKDIAQLAEARNDIILYPSPNNMAEIINQCDIAVSSGGNTLYELCSFGVAVIAFIYADNQTKLVTKLTNMNCIENIGFYDNIDYKLFSDVLNKYILNYNFRKETADRQYTLADGKGVYRIVDAILNLE